MNQYVTGCTIKVLREKQNMTQSKLAQLLNVSDKTISKWETGRGYPDITFLEPLSKFLKVSILELLSGNEIINNNKNSNLKKSQFYTCPICGNVIFSVGNTLISCCGLQLYPLEIENVKERVVFNNAITTQENCKNDIEMTKPFSEEHKIYVQEVEDELFVSLKHPMEKNHYISWIACIRYDSVQIAKLYPEQDAQYRFKYGKQIQFLAYCNKHGLFQLQI